jgi:DNA-binding LacI/PurR family transcriptional regulator
MLGVTPVTVRRDLARLADEGLVRRVHGGATLARPTASAGAEDEEPAPRLNRPIGMLVPSLDYYWPDVVRGAEEEARLRNLRVILRGSSYEADDDRSQAARLVEQGAEGLVLAPNMAATHAHELTEWLAEARIPAVLVERTATVASHDTAIESVVTDHAEGAAMAVRHLVELGHARIGLVTSSQSPTSPHIRRGWHQAHLDHGLATEGVVDTIVERPRSLEHDPTFDAIIEECLSTETTALLVHADAEAIAIVQRCEQHGLSVPNDLSIVAYDDAVAALLSPSLTAVRPPRTTIGRTAVALLAMRIDDPNRPTHRVSVSPSLNVRESTMSPRTIDPS